ncbi:retrotransposable element Tf2 [Tanacetum coccineum]
MFAKSSILGKPVLQPHRNQSVVRQPTAFNLERPEFETADGHPKLMSIKNVKPVTTHYLPKERESAIVKPHHVIASSESRNSSKTMPRLSSNDMVHNHYLEEAKKKDTRTRRVGFLRQLVLGGCFELTAFSDADHAGSIDTRKIMSRGIQFLGDKLVSWMSKKQDCNAMSSAETDTPVPSTSILDIILSRNKLKMVSVSCQTNGMRCLTPAELEVLANESV